MPPDDYVIAVDDDESGEMVTYASAEPQTLKEQWSAEPVRTPEEVQKEWDQFRRAAIKNRFDEEFLISDVEKVYSTSRAADFFGRSNQWLYWGLRKGIFTYKDGNPILPERVGPMGKRRFTLPLIREIALSCFRRGNLTEEELQVIMEKILLAEFGRTAFAEEKR